MTAQAVDQPRVNRWRTRAGRWVTERHCLDCDAYIGATSLRCREHWLATVTGVQVRTQPPVTANPRRVHATDADRQRAYRERTLGGRVTVHPYWDRWARRHVPTLRYRIATGDDDIDRPIVRNIDLLLPKRPCIAGEIILTEPGRDPADWRPEVYPEGHAVL